LFDNLNSKEDVSKLAYLFKKKVSKIFAFDWVNNIDAFLYIIDQLQHFRRSLKLIERRIIKIEERKLYIN